jgi:hypothetical protein
MARPKKRKTVDRTARCENGHEFPVKMKYLGHDAGEEVGYSQGIRWEPWRVVGHVTCPVCHTDRFELVEE